MGARPSSSSRPNRAVTLPTRPFPPPPPWRDSIENVLISPTALRRRIRTLARQIEADFAGCDLVVIALLNGTVIFTADLLRQISLPLHLGFIGISSYRTTTHPGTLQVTQALQLDVRGRDVLLMDDILDSGQTLHFAVRQLRALRPRRLRTCVLLQKDVPRRHRLHPHYVGFRIPNRFVVGYGLDYAERYRNLPFIGVLRGDQAATH